MVFGLLGQNYVKNCFALVPLPRRPAREGGSSPTYLHPCYKFGSLQSVCVRLIGMELSFEIHGHARREGILNLFFLHENDTRGFTECVRSSWIAAILRESESARGLISRLRGILFPNRCQPYLTHKF